MLGLFRRFRRRPRPMLTRRQAMAARPIRNPSLHWELDEEGNAVVTLTRRKDWVGNLLAWLFMVPESRPVRLDEIGTFVWQMCDGEHSFSDIAKALVERHKITMREAEVSLAEFLRMLGKRGMVAFILPPEIAQELTEEQRRALGIKVVKPEQQAQGKSDKPAKQDKPKRSNDQAK